MYETMDACNIKPIMPVEQSHKSDTSLIGRQFYDTSISDEFPDKKGLSAVRSDKEPQLITSGQPPDNSSCEMQDYHENTPYSFSSNPFNSTSIQYNPGLPNYSFDANTPKIQNNYGNFCQISHNPNEQYYNNNKYAINDVLNFNNSGMDNCFNSIEVQNNNAGQEDEFESVINPRSKLDSPAERDAHISSCPLYIEQFSNYTQPIPYSTQLQVNSEMTTMMIPTFPLDFIEPYNYLPQDTDDAFASVIYSTPPQIKPVLYSNTQTQSTFSQFYGNNINFNSYCTTDITKQNNTYAQSSSFTPFLSTEKDKNLQQSFHCEYPHYDQSQQNKNSCMNSPPTKHRTRVSSNEYKRYRSPATLIIQFPTSATTNGPDSQTLAAKNSSGTSISVSSERRARTRKVSSSPSLGRPRNNFTDIDIDDKKPVINFQKPTISSSNNTEKNNSQGDTKRYDSVAKTKIRGRK